MRVIALLLSPRYQLFSEATQRKIVVTEGTIKVLLKCYYPNIKSISVLLLLLLTSIMFLDLNSVHIFKLLNVVQKLQSSISRESISCQGQLSVLFLQSITMM